MRVSLKTDDPGDGVCDATCTLREAIEAANMTGDDDVINITVTGTITLNGTELTIENASFKHLLNARVLLLSLIYFGILIGLYGFSLWLPQIIQGFGGLSNIQIGLLTMIPYIFAAAEDSAENLWFGSSNGLIKYSDNIYTKYTQNEGLPNNSINDFHDSSRIGGQFPFSNDN